MDIVETQLTTAELAAKLPLELVLGQQSSRQRTLSHVEQAMGDFLALEDFAVLRRDIVETQPIIAT